MFENTVAPGENPSGAQELNTFCLFCLFQLIFKRVEQSCKM